MRAAHTHVIVLTQFALDFEGLYTNDENAMKAASHDTPSPLLSAPIWWNDQPFLLLHS